ncbi:MAG: sigma-70 family RNA polymerase sigma factor [Minicystis sp.]
MSDDKGRGRDGLRAEIQKHLGQARQGDRRARVEVIRLATPCIRGCVSGLLRGVACDPRTREDLIDEATQESVLSALQKLDDLRGDDFLSWAYAIARRETKRQRRKWLRSRGVEFQVIHGSGDQGAKEESDSHTTPEEAARDREILVKIIAEDVKKLSPDRQAIVVLFLEGYEVREIAQTTGLGPGAIGPFLTRWRAKVKAMYEETSGKERAA